LTSIRRHGIILIPNWKGNIVITAKARIVYDPLPGTKHFELNWMYATMSFDFIRMYNWFCFKKGMLLDIGTPHSTHISVIKGERPKYPEFWKYRDKEWINFEYEPAPYSDNGKHVWINVYSEELREIRNKLGLSDRRRFHITIGRFR
jgi:hypothetical protein